MYLYFKCYPLFSPLPYPVPPVSMRILSLLPILSIFSVLALPYIGETSRCSVSKLIHNRDQHGNRKALMEIS